jgi:hypothetical protein
VHSRLLQDVDLKYEESFGFTLHDIEPLRYWMQGLLASEEAVTGSDPYGGIKQTLSGSDGLTTCVIRFTRDLLIDWDDDGKPVGMMRGLNLGSPPLLRIVDNAGDVLLDVGGSAPQSIGREWRTTCAWLSEHPRELKRLIDRLEVVLAQTSRHALTERWDRLGPKLDKLYPETPDIDREVFAIRHGLRGPTGDLGHLIRR